MTDSSATDSPIQSSELDYSQLVKFLVGPFLASPDALRLDSEVSSRTGRILLRLAIEGEDKGKVFGRGGRNLQAIRSVVQTAASLTGGAVHLEVYGQSSGRDSGRKDGGRSGGRDGGRRSPKPAPRPKPKQG